MRKTMFRWLLALAILLPCMIAAASAASGGVTASGTCGGEGDGTNLTWTLYGDGELVISGSGVMKDYYSSNGMPWYSNRGEIKKVTIGNGVSSIGRSAFFSCNNLIDVTLPNSVTAIGDSAFSACASLNSIVIPNGVTAIEYGTFSNCTSLTSIVIPDNVTVIRKYAFNRCDSLTSVVIPSSVTGVLDGAFANCFGLESIVVETGNSDYYSVDGVLFDMYHDLCAYPGGKTDWTYSIPDGTRAINEYAFSGCVFLRNVKIPSSLDMILGVETPFKDCIALESIEVDENNANYSSVDGVLLNKSKYGILRYPQGKNGPYSIPDGVGAVEDGAFMNCAGLTEVVFPESVAYIGADAFDNCAGLTTVTIPNSVSTIDHGAFQGCVALTDVKIGKNVTQVYNFAFDNCTNLSRVEFFGAEPTYAYDAFSDCADDLVVYYHEGTTGWTDSVHYDAAAKTWYGYPLAMSSHTVVNTPAVAPTCVDGLTEGTHCSACGEVFIAQEVIPATGQHGYQLDAAVEATCTETGLTAGASCPTCGYVHLAQEVIPATGHSEVIDPAVEATCTETGLTEGSHCSVCGEVIVEQEEIPLVDHTPVTDPAVEPTCAAVGLTEGRHCDVCDEVLVAQESVAKNSHTVVIDQPKDAACAEVGYSGTGMHCSVCGEILLAQTEIPALGHDTIDHAAKAPTTDSVGWEAYQTCSRCDYTTYVELPKLEAVTPTRFRFSLEVVSTIVVDGQTVEICRWVWTPVE